MKKKKLSVMIYMWHMQRITFVAVILMASVFIFLTLWQNIQYGKIISNLTMATEFNFDFKSNIDYKMYRIVIGADTFESLKPYEDLENSRQLFSHLRDSTEYEGSKKGLDGLLTLVDMLDNRIHDIENSSVIGSYDMNMIRLDKDIYIITDLIEEKMSEYIYNETKTLESLRQVLEKQVALLIMMGILLAGMLFVFLIRYFGILSRKITNSLQALCEHTKRFAEGKMDAKAPESDVSEIQMLSDQYDEMSRRLKGLILNIREEQELKRQTELRLLQAQINPHFLYNTLDAIVWLAEGRQYKKVVDMITSLSTFLRIGLSQGRDSISIEEEVSHVRNYLQIQHFRYEDILDYRIEIEESVFAYSIPKLTLQPIVENALYHGIKNRRGRGTLLINGWMEQKDTIVIRIEDNGIGINAEKLDQLQTELRQGTSRESGDERSGFGLKNVSDRLRLTYGEEFGVLIESQYEVGTVITIRVPARQRVAGD